MTKSRDDSTIERYIEQFRKIARIIVPYIFISMSLAIILGEIRLYEPIPEYSLLKKSNGNVTWSFYDNNSVIFKIKGDEHGYLVNSTIVKPGDLGPKLEGAIGEIINFSYSPKKTASTKNKENFQYFYNVYEVKKLEETLLSYEDAYDQQSLISSYYNYIGGFFLLIGIILIVRTRKIN
ncbi:hypothetical protein [Rheinheimera sp.]|uniref:hypothetical protein n=1 Tax=Rheinheimera sp. TaxID=1869214 RepID=UPI00307D26B1